MRYLIPLLIMALTAYIAWPTAPAPRWTAFYYGASFSRGQFSLLGEFPSIEDCRRAVQYRASLERIAQPSYSCGVNCRQRGTQSALFCERQEQ